MKIISTFVFAATLIATWNMSRGHNPMGQTVQVGIQADLKNVIADYVQKPLSESKNLRFDKFWTESVKKDKIKATFVYSFDDSTQENGTARVEISGSAILNKVDENAETITYSLDELQILDNKIEFAEPIQITSGSERPSEPIEVPQTETR